MLKTEEKTVCGRNEKLHFFVFRYGRKITFFISLVIQLVFGIIAAFAPEYWTFTIARAIVGATTSGVFLVAYVIGKRKLN